MRACESGAGSGGPRGMATEPFFPQMRDIGGSEQAQVVPAAWASELFLDALPIRTTGR